MSESNIAADAAKNSEAVETAHTSAETQDANDAEKTFPEEYVRKLREEAKSNRLRAEKLEAEKKAAVEEQLKEQNKWQELAEQKSRELKEMEQYKEKSELLQQSFDVLLKREAEGIDEDLADAIISHPTLTHEQKLERLGKLKPTSKVSPPSAPATSKAQTAHDGSELDLFKTMRFDTKKRYEIAQQNPSQFQRFREWEKTQKL